MLNNLIGLSSKIQVPRSMVQDPRKHQAKNQNLPLTENVLIPMIIGITLKFFIYLELGSCDLVLLFWSPAAPNSFASCHQDPLPISAAQHKDPPSNT